MSEEFITAIERMEKPKKVRREGYIPGVIYGEEVEHPISVKFEMQTIKKFLRTRSNSAKVKIKEDIKNCVIKDIQTDAINGKILHIDMQAVTAKEKVKLKIPVIFNGRESLERQRLLLQVLVSEIELEGSITALPELINIDVSDKKLGDKIEIKDIPLNDSVKAMGDEDEALAVITTMDIPEEDTADTETPDAEDTDAEKENTENPDVAS